MHPHSSMTIIEYQMVDGTPRISKADQEAIVANANLCFVEVAALADSANAFNDDDLPVIDWDEEFVGWQDLVSLQGNGAGQSDPVNSITKEFK